MKCLDPEPEAKLLEEYYKVDKDVARQMVTIACTARKAYREEKTITHVSTRSLLQWAELMFNGMDRKLAYEVCIVRKATPVDQGAFLDYYNAVFKEKSSSNVNPLDDPTPIIATVGEINRYKDKIQTSDKELGRIKTAQDEINRNLIQFKDDYQKLNEINKKLQDALPSENKLKRLSEKMIELHPNSPTNGHKFAIGDVVMARPNAPYSETTSGWKGVVIDYADSLLVLGNIEGGEVYTVSQDYFDKVEIQ
jgi:hypothetical protein